MFTSLKVGPRGRHIACGFISTVICFWKESNIIHIYMKKGHIFSDKFWRSVQYTIRFSRSFVTWYRSIIRCAQSKGSREMREKSRKHRERRKIRKKRGLQEEIQETDACVAYRDFRNVVLAKLQHACLRAERAQVTEMDCCLCILELGIHRAEEWLRKTLNYDDGKYTGNRTTYYLQIIFIAAPYILWFI